jgi:DeoR family deoxyribose operon repressor
MTVRRDLEILEKRDLVKVLHGGAVYNFNGSVELENKPDYLLQKQKSLQKEEKIRIAKAAIALINPEETIMLDTGTTIYYLAKELPQDMPFTAICWSLNILQELIKKSQCNLISTGGTFHPETQMFESKQGREIISNKRASKAFISAGGFHKELGITCPFDYEISTKREAIHSSLTNILLFDSSKFGRVCSSHLANVDVFDIIITDSNISEEYKDYILQEGIQLIIV